MCKRLHVQPEEVVFVDDMEANIAAARELGIHAVLCKDTDHAIADVKAVLMDEEVG